MSQDDSGSIQNGKRSTQEVPVIVWEDSESTSNNSGSVWNNTGECGRTNRVHWTTQGPPEISQGGSRSIQNSKGSTQEVPVNVWDDSQSTSNNSGIA